MIDPVIHTLGFRNRVARNDAIFLFDTYAVGRGASASDAEAQVSTGRAACHKCHAWRTCLLFCHAGLRWQVCHVCVGKLFVRFAGRQHVRVTDRSTDEHREEAAMTDEERPYGHVSEDDVVAPVDWDSDSDPDPDSGPAASPGSAAHPQ